VDSGAKTASLLLHMIQASWDRIFEGAEVLAAAIVDESSDEDALKNENENSDEEQTTFNDSMGLKLQNGDGKALAWI